MGRLYKLFNSYGTKLNAVAVVCARRIPMKGEDSKSSGLTHIEHKFQTLKDKTLF